MSSTEMTTTQAQPQGQKPQATAEARAFATPPVDVFESQEGYLLLADLPGVEAESIQLDLERDELTLQAKRSDQPIDFRRRFALGAPIDADAVSARLEHGVLRIEVPKAEEARPRSIPVLAA